MQYLFNVITSICDKPVFYGIIQINENEYVAKPKDTRFKSFKFVKENGNWTAENNKDLLQAQQIGDKIDKICVSAIKN